MKILLYALQGATIVDQIVSITPAENYVIKREMQVNIYIELVVNAIFSCSTLEFKLIKCNFCRK